MNSKEKGRKLLFCALSLNNNWKNKETIKLEERSKREPLHRKEGEEENRSPNSSNAKKTPVESKSEVSK